MTLDLPGTVAILVAALALLGFAIWRAGRPPNPMKVRMINYHVVQLFTIIVVLLMLAHLVGLVTGHQMVGRRPPLGAP